MRLFPKRDRYSLGQKLDCLALTTIEQITFAGTSEREQKLPFLEKSVVSVDLLKILIRLSKDVRALDEKKYLILSEKLQEIGRMLGGWKRSIKNL